MTNLPIIWRPQLDHIYAMDALTFLRQIEDESVNCGISSPPYFALRSYLDAADPLKPLEIGSEPSPQAFVETMVRVFREVRRVLRSDGVLWLNLGDSYVSSPPGNSNVNSSGLNGAQTSKIYAERLLNKDNRNRRDMYGDIPSKNLLGIPWRVALALQADGWYLRQDNILAKRNPMPESVTDRTTRAHEYMFQLTKSANYWYDADAIREENSSPEQLEHNLKYAKSYEVYDLRAPTTGQPGNVNNVGIHSRPGAAGRNKRSVWWVTSEPYAEAHFATFGTKWIEPCILAGCPPKVCRQCGAPYERVTESKRISDDAPSDNLKLQSENVFARGGNRATYGRIGYFERQDLGWRPTCACTDAATRPGVVLDPFIGSGTTALVAKQQGRHYLGCDLNPDYVTMASLRIDGSGIDRLNAKAPEPLEDKQLPGGVIQPALFTLEEKTA